MNQTCRWVIKYFFLLTWQCCAQWWHTRPTFNKSVMVTVAVSTLGCSDILFLEPSVKINGEYYRNTVLHKMLLADIRRVSGDMYTFQQDSASAHHAHTTVEMPKTETPDFIPPDLWPPNSPDLNVVDYSIWSILQEKVYRHRINDLDELKQQPHVEWSNLDHAVITAGIRQWHRRLSACVQAGSGHFEHHFYFSHALCICRLVD